MGRQSKVALAAAIALVLLGSVVIVVTVLRGVGSSAGPPAANAAGSASAQPASTEETTVPGPSTQSCPPPWDCAQTAHFTAANALLKTVTTGHIGVVVKDRQTGAIWQGGEPAFRIWAGSTPKLAFAVALEEEAAAGQLTLDATAKTQIAAMLKVSDNNSAESLWNRYAKSDPNAFMQRFKTKYGMTSAGYVTGFPSRWGFVKCTARDLANLMSYILDTMSASLRTYFVTAMRGVGSVQQWGVWGAGSALQPGVKNGWSVESDEGKDHWITATVGFVGPNERYVVAAMYHQLPGGDTIDRGVHTLTDLVATLFGQPTPAPATIPADY